MTSDLSIFAARLRGFISICVDEAASAPGELALALHAHHDIEFSGMALVLFALQFNRNLAYRKFCEARRVVPDIVAHWTQIPAVPASAFKELELTCLPAEECTVVFHSSGTMEQRPSRHFHSAESLALYEASLWPPFEVHVLPEYRRPNAEQRKEHFQFLMLTPPPDHAPHSSLVKMFDVARQKLELAPSVFAGKTAADGAWTLNTGAALSVLRDASAGGWPLVIAGTAFSFVRLLDHLAERNLRFKLPPGSRVMETGGYKGRSRALAKADLHSLIAERLGIPGTHIVCEYGMSELSSQAYDLTAGNPHGARTAAADAPKRLFRFPLWARVQVVSPETGREVAEGETGLLRVFDLANVFSVMAIQTEDLAIRRGDGFELIGRADSAELRGCSLMSIHS